MLRTKSFFSANISDLQNSDILMRDLFDRYGSLALARAAGQALAAERCGDHQQIAIWHHIIVRMRHNVLADDQQK